ncbi:MAG: rod shape-determining protein [Flavobacteriaceae bacterium]|nr:rod shape-determining protein [Flavobacteriaceae bacterium]
MFSFLTEEVAIDLGTANTIIILNDKVVINEPSIVTINRSTKKLVALGLQAQMMLGRTPDELITIRPLRDGVIADYNAAEKMITGFLNKITKHSSILPRSLKMVVCVPSGATEVEMRAVRDSAQNAQGRDVHMIYEPVAAAIGMGIDVSAPEGNMVVDIGGGTTEIAVIALGGIVTNKSIRIAGDEFTLDIQEYMKHQHNIKIGERTAEEIKINVGAAISDLEDPPIEYSVRGPNSITSLPVTVPVAYQEVAHAIEKSITKIENAILDALEHTPPELYADIAKNGIYLAGGGALLKGLDKRLEKKFDIPFHIADDPLKAVARGTGIALKQSKKFQAVLFR